MKIPSQFLQSNPNADTLPKIGVLADRFTPGFNRPDDPVPHLTIMALRDAIETHHNTYSHFCTYQPINDPGPAWPRINKAALPHLRQGGVDLVCTMLVFDYDTPGHVAWTADAQGKFFAHLDAAVSGWPPAWGWTCFYTTRKGARFIYVLDRPVPVDQAESNHKWMVGEFHRNGVLVDPATSDWTRIFALPYVVRDGSKTWEDTLPVQLFWQTENRLPVDSLGTSDTTAAPIPAAPPVEQSAAPVVDDALALCTLKDGGRTDWFKEAKRRLRGRDCYSCLFEDAPLAQSGSRNATIHKYVGQAISLLIGMETTTPETIYGLFLPPVQQLSPDPGTPDWLAELWRSIGKIWAMEKTKIVEHAADVVLDRAKPLESARKFLDIEHTIGTDRSLIYSGGTFYKFNGTSYQELEADDLRAQLYRFTDRAKRPGKESEPSQPFNPTKRDVDYLLDGLKSEVIAPAKAPCWNDGQDGRPPVEDLLVAPNGVFHLSTDGASLLCPPTPQLFTSNSLDYDLLLNSDPPAGWLAFLGEIFEADADAIGLLQEWFGYVLTPDTRQQKILLVVGPKRSGKGTIARVFKRMLGDVNVCAPTLAGLATPFGCWPLIGKMLAIVGDARLSGRPDQAVVTERLLSISGEDAITVDRKNLKPITLTFPTRIMILSNELPRLNDSSTALANRFLILSLSKSFLGREDTELTEKLCLELPSILRWAIDGRTRLHKRGHFVQPDKSAGLRQEVEDLASPVSAFVRDACTVNVGLEVEVGQLFRAWCLWCDEQGNHHHDTVQMFSRNLRAAVPGIDTDRSMRKRQRSRFFTGIALAPSPRRTEANR